MGRKTWDTLTVNSMKDQCIGIDPVPGLNNHGKSGRAHDGLVQIR